MVPLADNVLINFSVILKGVNTCKIFLSHIKRVIGTSPYAYALEWNKTHSLPIKKKKPSG